MKINSSKQYELEIQNLKIKLRYIINVIIFPFNHIFYFLFIFNISCRINFRITQFKSRRITIILSKLCHIQAKKVQNTPPRNSLHNKISELTARTCSPVNLEQVHTFFNEE